MKRTSRIRLIMAALALVVIGYSWLTEPDRIAVRRVVIHDPVLARAWRGLTIVHLSDLHLARLGERERRILTLVKGLNPDLIALTGDYKQWQADPAPAQQFLARLSAPLGVYGVLGDADAVSNGPQGCAYCHPGDRYRERISTPTLLQNELRRVPFRGGTIDVAGVGLDEEGNPGDWVRRLQALARDGHRPLLLLSHSSLHWQGTRWDSHALWLAGDTHGGQIRMPGWFWEIFAYKPDTQHMGGVYRGDSGGWLIVNRGLGTTLRFPFRLGVPPEILVITFADAEGGQR